MLRHGWWSDIRFRFSVITFSIVLALASRLTASDASRRTFNAVGILRSGALAVAR